MTIMLAGGMSFAIPGMEPAMAASANLYVSTQNFGGPMVVQINVIDQDYKETDEAKPMPSVTIDGKDLIMAQGSDGNWYAYVAEKEMAAYADSQNLGLEFGTPVSNTTFLNSTNDFDSTATVYSANGTTVLSNPQSLNDGTSIPDDVGTIGQIGIPNLTDWPLIQTFDFTDDSDIKVVYARAGSPQTEVIKYKEDMYKQASYSTDRIKYPHNADIHLLIDDKQLNIDPTDEDTWTFNVLNNTSYYGINSLQQINSTAQNALFYGDNGYLVVNAETVINFQDNQDSHTFLRDGYDGINYVTVLETSRNTGLFENTDSGNKANMLTTTDPLRGVKDILEYNKKSGDVFVEYFLGSVDMDKSSIKDDWSSGEKMRVNIIDEDQNLNTKADNDFDVSDSAFIAIPSLEFGNPFTLDKTTAVTVIGVANQTALLEQQVTVNAELNTVNALVIANQTAYDTVNSAHATEIADLNLNKTKWNGFVTANATLVAENIGGDPLVLAILQANLDGAYAGVAQIEAQLVAVFNAAETAIINAFEDLLSLQTTLVTQLNDINAALAGSATIPVTDFTVKPFSKILSMDTSDVVLANNPTFTISTSIDSSILNDKGLTGVNSLINYDFRSLNAESVTLSGADGGTYNLDNKGQGLVSITELPNDFAGALTITVITDIDSDKNVGTYNVIFDVFTFGQDNIGKRYNDAIYRFEAEESEKNSGIYTGTIEYTQLTQINIFKLTTFSNLETIGDELEIIVDEDLTDEDAIEVIYYDTDRQGIQTQVSAVESAPTYSGVVSFDNNNYKVADTVTITIEDKDLNSNSETQDIYTTVDTDDISLIGFPRSLLLDVTFNDAKWQSCTVDGVTVDGLYRSMASIVETELDSGIFTTTFQIPKLYCQPDGSGGVTIESVTGTDIEINYQDFRDSSGEEIEVGDSAGIRANTGSISLDRTVYPVPFGAPSEGASGEKEPSAFAIHATGITGENTATTAGSYLDSGDLTIHVRINDPDFDLSASGEDKISESTTNGPVKVMISRGSSTVLIGTAGASTTSGSLITFGDQITNNTREFGPIVEIAPDAGIFELDLSIRYTDGPSSTTCPTSVATSVSHIETRTNIEHLTHCILQGDILTVEYTDPTDASGSLNTVTDSATFDLRNGVLQADKSVYLIGSDMILTLIEPDLDLDNDQAESYDLDLIEWDSDAAQLTMGNRGGGAVFDPEPSSFRETGDSTGIFQVVIEIPEALNNDKLERGEEIQLEYTDWGPSGADYVGGEDEDINLTVFTSNFGATVELDQKVYTWTDKVYITIVAPDHNFDGDLVDEIGNTDLDPIKVSTRGNDIDNYKLVETGTDTGIFTGEVILTGFTHDSDGDTTTGDSLGNDKVSSAPSGVGPTDGLLPADDDDGLTVSFEFSEDETVVGSSLIRWNIGETQWLEASYPASGTGVVRIVDPDMNHDPESVDNFNVDVWSDSDAGGIDLTVTETNEATGIFEGTVFFTTTDESSGHRLRVAEGDTVTAEYEDNTLPDPYTTADELDITATTLIGTIVPPLERAVAANLRTVDAFGNSLSSVTVDQQVQISAELASGQDREQTFAYLVQIQNDSGVTVSLAWITGSLQSGQNFAPALSWIPENSGSYTATAFVWESVDNPTALSPPVSTTITVS